MSNNKGYFKLFAVTYWQHLKMSPVCVPKHFEPEDEKNDDRGVEGVDGRNDDSNDESRQCRNDGHYDEGNDGPEEDDLGRMLYNFSRL
jgi:hypothetical protein